MCTPRHERDILNLDSLLIIHWLVDHRGVFLCSGYSASVCLVKAQQFNALLLLIQAVREKCVAVMR